jgi:hypothetical protein
MDAILIQFSPLNYLQGKILYDISLKESGVLVLSIRLITSFNF